MSYPLVFKYRATGNCNGKNHIHPGKFPSSALTSLREVKGMGESKQKKHLSEQYLNISSHLSILYSRAYSSVSRSEVLTTGKTLIVVFWVCGSV
jgi:hypothetical protein